MFVTPRPEAVLGISCVRPRAPAPEPALGLKPDSCLIRPASSAGSSPLAFAAAVMSVPNGVPFGSSETPVAAVGAVVGIAAVVAAAGVVAPLAIEAKLLVPWAFASALEKLVEEAAAGWAAGGAKPPLSIDWICAMRLIAASMLMRRFLGGGR